MITIQAAPLHVHGVPHCGSYIMPSPTDLLYTVAIIGEKKLSIYPQYVCWSPLDHYPSHSKVGLIES